eukprot:TRINITY_DN1689_c0_g1_i1.p2 TRINITY_DN1689_c0_g1~~TRINITY_DN1689_c0_g1_i1.p2  ORF type:complete len:206 (-),score=81.44 TRINITY_DN1689_c0_g1_i1:304-846(-)
MNQHNAKCQQQAVEQGLLGYIIKLCMVESNSTVLRKAIGVVTAVGGGPNELAMEQVRRNAAVLVPIFAPHTASDHPQVRAKALNLLGQLMQLAPVESAPALAEQRIEDILARAFASPERTEVDVALMVVRTMARKNMALLNRLPAVLRDAIEHMTSSEDDFTEEIEDVRSILKNIDTCAR